MRKSILGILLIAGILFPMSVFAVAADEIKEPDWGPVEEVESYTVGPGIKYTKYIYPDKPLLIWFTEIDLTNPYNKIEQVQSRNAVPDVSRWDVPTFYKENSRKGHKVKVAWNHDFFSYDMGVCIGINISDGEFTWRRDYARSLLAITKDKKAEIFSHSGLVTRVVSSKGLTLDISGYNSDATYGFQGDCILLNRMNSRTLTDAGKYIKLKPQGEWLVNGDPIPCKVEAVSDEPIQTTPTEYVLYLRNGAIDTFNNNPLSQGDEVTIVQQFTGTNWGTAPKNILNAFHGYPSLVHDGVFHDGEYNNFENGREYEKSSHVLAGISKDKTKLYMVINEMSSQSTAVDCVELCGWMVNRGAWDIVNFDSGGSAAIVIDEEMLNLPGRGSVRPVEDAMLAVSIAPESDKTARIAFSKSVINTSVIAIAPLRVMAFNEYDEVLDKDLKGCSFSCEPALLGNVDANGYFHSGTVGMSGKIIAEKDGLRAEIPVNTIAVDKVAPKYSEIVIDKHHSPLIELIGTTSTATFALSPLAFTWEVADPEVCHISDGILYADKNGKTEITGTFADVSVKMVVNVEIAEKAVPVTDFIDENAFTRKLSGVSNFESSLSPLPEGWTSGSVWKFDITGSRQATIDLTFNKTLFGLPESLSFELEDKEEVIKNAYFIYEDALGEKVTRQVDLASGSVINTAFADNQLEYYSYPLKLNMIRFNLDVKKRGTGKSIALRNMATHYASESGVETIEYDLSETLNLNLHGETLEVSYDSQCAGMAKLSMFSATGQLVAVKDVDVQNGNNTFFIDAKNAGMGIYFVVLQSKNARAIGKCVIR